MAHEHCVLDSKGYRHILITCNSSCFSITKFVTRKRLNITSYVDCRHCYILTAFHFVLPNWHYVQHKNKWSFPLWRCAPMRAMASLFLMRLDHTQRRNTFGRTLLDERSARCRDLYLTTHNTHKEQTAMPSVGFEPAIPARKRPRPTPYTAWLLGLAEMKWTSPNLQISFCYYQPPAKTFEEHRDTSLSKFLRLILTFRRLMSYIYIYIYIYIWSTHSWCF